VSEKVIGVSRILVPAALKVLSWMAAIRDEFVRDVVDVVEDATVGGLTPTGGWLTEMPMRSWARGPEASVMRYCSYLSSQRSIVSWVWRKPLSR
jgi:hypothetical protein